MVKFDFVLGIQSYVKNFESKLKVKCSYTRLAERNYVLGSALRSIIFSQSRSEQFNFRICMITLEFQNLYDTWMSMK